MVNNQIFYKNIILHLIAFLLVVLNFSNLKIYGLSYLMPSFDLMMIFYFTIFRNTFSTWFIFLLGLWSDALNGSPLGSTSLCYIVLIKLFSVANEKIALKDDFHQIWQQFIFFISALFFLKLLMLSAFNLHLYNINVLVLQAVISCFCYVIMHRFFDYLNRELLED
jgi:rod shape-determining protein MreD